MNNLYLQITWGVMTGSWIVRGNGMTFFTNDLVINPQPMEGYLVFYSTGTDDLSGLPVYVVRQARHLGSYADLPHFRRITSQLAIFNEIISIDNRSHVGRSG